MLRCSCRCHFVSSVNLKGLHRAFEQCRESDELDVVGMVNVKTKLLS